MQPNNLPQYPNQVPQQPQPNPYGTVPVQMPKDQKPVGLYVAIAVVSLLLLAALIFGVWAFMSRQDYKSNSDEKAQAAVLVANEQQKKDLEAQFAEQEKSPLKSYTSPASSGSVKIVYPKTWSAYVAESATGSNPVDGYFYVNFVPAVNGKNNYYLRLQVVDTAYKSVADSYNSAAKQGTVKISAYVPEQVKNATPGIRVDGQLDAQKKGSMVILPLRDKTLKVWTENEASAADFNNIVLKNLTYSP